MLTIELTPIKIKKNMFLQLKVDVLYKNLKMRYKKINSKKIII